MNIYVSHSGNYDYVNELYVPIKKADFYTKHTFFFPHDSENIDTKAGEIIKDSDLLIAEVSHPSTGQGIEIGLASAAGVPIVCLYKEGAKVSSSLRFVTSKLLPYDDADSLLATIASQLIT